GGDAATAPRTVAVAQDQCATQRPPLRRGLHRGTLAVREWGVHIRRKVLVILGLAAVVLVAFAAPTDAQDDGSARSDRRISISGSVVVATDEVVDGSVLSFDGPVIVNGTVDGRVFIGDGRATIRGHVTGSVLVVHGDVLITGRVDDDVVALDGRITTRAGARVTGDVKSRKQP